MNLTSIRIKNYRSIKDATFNITKLDDDSFTYGLIGVNEAGKSSILKSMALRDNLSDSNGNKLPLKKDFKDKSVPVEIIYDYQLTKEEVTEIDNLKIATNPPAGTEINDGTIKVNRVEVTSYFDFESNNTLNYKIVFFDKENHSTNYPEIFEDIKAHIINRVHKPIFWTAEDRYLISQPINLTEFSANPDSVSIPLKNCFYLAGITNIKEKISSLVGDSTELEQLQITLGETVTDHINTVWKDHPITISFIISDGVINFHVKDINAKSKAKTADQRSDGFKQFISFLLTVSAQNKNNELKDSILLLDEPETHLHPQAQEALLEELIRITKNNRNNIAFFATHSNYMIDKKMLSRNYKISKPDDETIVEKFSKKRSTYASVNYDVFNIISSDYHNELYGFLHQKYQDDNPTDDKAGQIMHFDEVFFHQQKKLKKEKPYKEKSNAATLPTYIRNCIHHPEGRHCFSESDLKTSIELLISYLI